MESYTRLESFCKRVTSAVVSSVGLHFHVAELLLLNSIQAEHSRLRLETLDGNNCNVKQSRALGTCLQRSIESNDYPLRMPLRIVIWNHVTSINTASLSLENLHPGFSFITAEFEQV